MPTPRPLSRVMLTLPNCSWLDKRPWLLLPYGLGLLNASLRRHGYESWIYDPNAGDQSVEQVRAELRRTRPDVVGIGSGSTEYTREMRLYSQLVKEELPDAIVVGGGLIPTALIDTALADPHVDYWVMGEGEHRLPALLAALAADGEGLDQIDGLAYGQPAVIQPRGAFISDLDAVGLPDYGGLDVPRYTQHVHQYASHFIPRQWPWAITLTSRGCPYRCCFCAAKTVTGSKVRLRSAESVLAEVDWLAAEHGVREVIFNDDHFLFDRPRALAIMRGIAERHPGMTWKCLNVSLWALDEELLAVMRETGSYQLTLSVESGSQRVLDEIIHKPVKLKVVPQVVAAAKRLGFELIVNFVIGFPGETWEEIRQTCDYAGQMDVDVVNFHLATPMPHTELMDVCLEEGYLTPGEEVHGFTSGVIATDEFTVQELQILRAFEWDRINFASAARREVAARMHGITLDDLAAWRRRTRQRLGVTANWKQAEAAHV